MTPHSRTTSSTQELLLFSSIILAISLISAPCPGAEVFPVDTVQLWEGVQQPHGDEVSLTVYCPQTPNGAALVICPGGSYHWHDIEGEGYEVAEWFSNRGFTCFVLKYRAAGVPEIVWHTRLIFRGKRHPDMITDGQRALQWVWDNADSYGIDRKKIGIMGFSAGGHLALSTAFFSSSDFLELSGIKTDACLRPAFVAGIYPVVTMRGPYVHRRSRRGILGDSRVGSRRMQDSLSLELHVPADCPPVFLVNCVDDPVVDYRNSVLLDSALTSNKVPHRYIQYERGKHGFGVSDYYGSPECREWKNEFLNWVEAYL